MMGPILKKEEREKNTLTSDTKEKSLRNQTVLLLFLLTSLVFLPLNLHLAEEPAETDKNTIATAVRACVSVHFELRECH